MTARRWRVLLVHAASDENATFSYQHAWPRHVAAHPRFEVTPLNLGRRRVGDRIGSALAVRRWRGDAIVLLHSAFSNTQLLTGRLLDAVARRDEPKVFFIGNEYKAMPEKMRFCENLRIALLVSQSSAPEVHALYRERLGCAVIGIPNTGLDPMRFAPTPGVDRPIDIGYRSEPSPIYLGHTEREDLAEYFSTQAARLGLAVDISMNRRDRFDETGWAAFLNRCKAQLGSEAGGDYFELTDRTRTAVNDYHRSHPDLTAADVHRLFFSSYQRPTPLRIISGRHIEAAGTRTIQLLFRGHYDGYFRPDEHYIPLEKDFSNVDEALRKLRDGAYAERIAANAYHLVMSTLTYDVLIDRFASALDNVASPASVH